MQCRRARAERILLARLGEAHSREGSRQGFRVHLASRTLQVIVLPSLRVGGLQSTGEAKLRALLVGIRTQPISSLFYPLCYSVQFLGIKHQGITKPANKFNMRQAMRHRLGIFDGYGQTVYSTDVCVCVRCIASVSRPLTQRRTRRPSR